MNPKTIENHDTAAQWDILLFYWEHEQLQADRAFEPGYELSAW